MFPHYHTTCPLQDLKLSWEQKLMKSSQAISCVTEVLVMVDQLTWLIA
jgi:hypothetical protein